MLMVMQQLWRQLLENFRCVPSAPGGLGSTALQANEKHLQYFEAGNRGEQVQGGQAVVVTRIGVGMWFAEERRKRVRLALYGSSMQGVVDGAD